MEITGQTSLLGVIGYPIQHTLSPEIHNFLNEKYKVPYIYVPLEITPLTFHSFIKNIKALNNLKGFNITVPYKVKIIKYLDAVSEEARFIGAVNTVNIENNRLTGYNTDHYGFLKALLINFPDFSITDSTVLLIGAGGAAKAVAYALLKRNIKQIIIMNRTLLHGQHLRKILQKKFPRISMQTTALQHDFLKKSGLVPDLIINTSTVGLKKDDRIILDLDSLKGNKTIVYDLIYNPPKTSLLTAAVRNKLRILNGKDMLILQALQAYSIWTGISLDKQLIKDLKILQKRV